MKKVRVIASSRKRGFGGKEREGEEGRNRAITGELCRCILPTERASISIFTYFFFLNRLILFQFVFHPFPSSTPFPPLARLKIKPNQFQNRRIHSQPPRGSLFLFLPSPSSCGKGKKIDDPVLHRVKTEGRRRRRRLGETRVRKL